MQQDSKQVSLIAAQAAHHLHAVVSHIATALLDVTDERILFSNSALSHLNGSTMLNLARHYLTKSNSPLPALHVLEHTDHQHVYFIVLDQRHVFVVIGKAQDNPRIQEFSQRLGRLLHESVYAA